MFIVLLAGIYAAYKHFSGLDPLKVDPSAVIKSLVSAKSVEQFLTSLTSFKISTLNKKEQNKVLERLVQSENQNLSYIFKFMLVADVHNDNENLKKAILQVKQNHPDAAFIIGLGDYTDVGTIEELKNAKKELDSAGIRYFVIAGDHDLWDARDKQKAPVENFKQVFGPTFQSFTFNNFKFLLLDNSDNYLGLGSDQQSWILSELEKAKTEGSIGMFAFIHEPLYHPSSDHFMGRVEKNLKIQADSLIFQLKSAGVKKIFSADTHYFSEYEEPVTKLPMVTVGAVVRDRNPQLPRFAAVYVFADGSSKIEDVQIR